jgi:hypothetical protein
MAVPIAVLIVVAPLIEQCDGREQRIARCSAMAGCRSTSLRTMSSDLARSAPIKSSTEWISPILGHASAAEFTRARWALDRWLAVDRVRTTQTIRLGGADPAVLRVHRAA